MDKGWSVGGGEGKLGSPREGRGGEFCKSQTACIFPMTPGEGCVTPERYGGGQGRGRFSCELQRKQQKGPRQEGHAQEVRMPLAVTRMHQRGPGPPDATDATKDASLYKGKQVIREADSPLLKGKKTVKPKWRKALGIRKERNIPFCGP